jgi:molybdopterin-guanine dinucleotide biosynthesis protein A
VPDLRACILSGGHSSRFGSDKALARIDGLPLLLRIAAVLRPLTSAVTVVADRADKYADLGLRTIADRHAGLGPLAGLHAALTDAGEEVWVLLASCDIIDLRPHWLTQLLAARSDNVSAVAWWHGRWEPLLALYHTRLVPEVERRLTRRQLSLQSLLDAIPVARLSLPHDWPAVFQINTRAELETFLSNREGEAPAEPKVGQTFRSATSGHSCPFVHDQTPQSPASVTEPNHPPPLEPT